MQRLWAMTPREERVVRIVSAARRVLGLAVLAALAIGPAVQAGAVTTDWSVRSAAGFDSNPMRIADDGQNGAYVSLGLYGKLSQRVSRSTRWFADARLDERRFQADADLADRTHARLRAGWSLRPRARSFSLVFGGSYEIDRLSYIDRETAQRYSLSDSGGQPVDLGDRYDRDVPGLFLNAQYKISSRARIVVRSSFEQSRYREDYMASVGISPLDSDSLEIRPELRLALRDGLSLAFGVDRTTVDYDQRLALDGGGDPVDGVTRHYEYTQFVARVRYEPTDRWGLRLGLRMRDRDDSYAGYYDLTGSLGYVALDRGLGENGTLLLYGSFGSTEYGTATVSGNGQEEPRGGDVMRLMTRYRHDLSERLRLYGELGTRSTDDRDPIYAYDRTWTAVGIEFRK